MAAFGAGTGEIGDLIGQKTGLGCPLQGQLIEPGRLFRFGKPDLAAGGAGGERGAGLECELIEREMGKPEPQRLVEFSAPGALTLAGPGIDQVDGKSRKEGLGCRDRPPRLRHPVRAAEEAERLFIEALHPEREPVDARLTEGGEFRGLDRGWIGLERHFEVIARREESRGRLDQPGGLLGVHQARRAAPEEDRGERAGPEAGGLEGELAVERGGEPLPFRLGPDVAIEVAIGAFAHAVGPVDIERERLWRGIGNGGGRAHGGI